MEQQQIKCAHTTLEYVQDIANTPEGVQAAFYWECSQCKTQYTLRPLNRNPIDQAHDYVEELESFLLWLTPCADDTIPDAAKPSYKVIGEKAKELLALGEVSL